MGRAKDIVLRPVTSKIATPFVKQHHYSGKVMQKSTLHLGVYYHNKLEGVMSFGSSIDIRRTSGLVEGTGWNEFIELNRMAFTDVLPRNSESRAIAIAMKLMRQYAPQIKWVISFADATQCGDGTIYRASNFVLTGIKKNRQIIRWNDQLIAKKTLDNKNYPKINGRYFSAHLLNSGEAEYVDGYQLRYIYFIDKSYRQRLTVPELPFSAIDEMGAGMYRGQKR